METVSIASAAIDERDVLPPAAQDRATDARPLPLPDLHAAKPEKSFQAETESPAPVAPQPPPVAPTPLHFEDDEPGEEEPPEPKSFERTQSPAAMPRYRAAGYGKVGEQGINKMHRFSLYETSSRYYLIGADVMDKQFRVLKIDRTAPPETLSIFEDDIVYDKREMNQLLNAIDDGNKAAGGLKLKCSTWGVLGFIRFTDAYYMLLISKRAQVALVGGHFVYQVEGTELVPITIGSTSRFQRDRNPTESRYLSILNALDLNHFFYFSYSYNVTWTLQKNMIRERNALHGNLKNASPPVNDMFVWNHHLLQPAREVLRNTYVWCLPMIYGFIDQSPIDVFGKKLYLTVIARRSRFYAGARFLKRGTNDLGYVANDVETEQILSDMLTTSFHAPGPRLFANPTYTSYVQHRGSIPLYWTQDNAGVSPKPDIKINLDDPFYAAAALHFDNLYERYGAPIYVLNLIKARERQPRESKLLTAYRAAIDYLNQSLPVNDQIIYRAFDMSRASKTRGQDVIGTLELIAEDVMNTTSFFHNGDGINDVPSVQNGVARTNCIDCLDRTNAAQFVIGKRALGRQLHALGVIPGDTVEYDTDAVNIFTRMWHDHGDTIAIQYGGSHLVNTMATYRKTNQWQSQSRDMVESFKRYYHNSFLDSQRQEAYNLFLGNYIFTEGQPMLWDLASDYHLHHLDPRKWTVRAPRKNYIEWFTPEFLEKNVLPPTRTSGTRKDERDGDSIADHDDYWLEYYRPSVISSFAKVFSFRKNTFQPHLMHDKNTHRNAPEHDLSPFVPRKPPQEPDSPYKKVQRKGVTILDPSHEETAHGSRPGTAQSGRPPAATVPGQVSPVKTSILRERHARREGGGRAGSSSDAPTSTSKAFVPADKTLMKQWTLKQFHQNSLRPSVTAAEAHEYDRYVSHPLNLPLILSGGADADATPGDSAYLPFVEYLQQANAAHDGQRVAREDVAAFVRFLDVGCDPLTVADDDGSKKRYKAYRQWLRGKSLFKQSKVDPECGESTGSL